MCRICSGLMQCPVGESRRSIILSPTKGIEKPIASVKTEIVLDRYSDKVNAFMHTECSAGGYWHNDSMVIKHCPICGEKFR
jgi:rubrerythrin